MFDRWNVRESTALKVNLARYSMAGLSNDCSSVYFYGDREVVVHSLRVSQSATSVESFRKKFDGDTRVWDVALSKKLLGCQYSSECAGFSYQELSADTSENLSERQLSSQRSCNS